MSRPDRRAFVVVIDACGIGALPDAADYGDVGADTLGHVAEAVGALRLPTLGRLGLGSIRPLPGLAAAADPALHGRLHAQGPGKDSTAGHWELMGVIQERPMPTYPDGFPPEVIDRVRAAAGGRGVVCNRPYEGIGAIEDFGAEHLATGALIVYTSEDSVLQIAAHVDVVGEAELGRICRTVRAALTGPHAVGRVIARPFGGPAGRLRRTDGRHDYALEPPARSRLDELHGRGVPVHAVGKAADLFSGRGIDHAHAGATNAAALAVTGELIAGLEHGLVFTNLIETDQVYGHRHDAAGFHGALQEIDAAVARWIARLGPEDLLVITADHGVDPASPKTDHTREHVPLLALFPGHGSRRHDGPMADVGASAVAWLTREDPEPLPGTPFLAGAIAGDGGRRRA